LFRTSGFGWNTNATFSCLFAWILALVAPLSASQAKARWVPVLSLKFISVLLFRVSSCSLSCARQVFEISADKNFGEVHESSLKSCENMVQMSELTEAAILHNLRLRYTEDQIYVCQADCL
jgi:myosin heavy subunit